VSKVVGAALATALAITLAALGLWAVGGHESAVAQGTVNFDVDPETTGNSADTLGTIEDCVRLDIPSPSFDDVSDYNVDIVVYGDTQAPIAYDVSLTYANVGGGGGINDGCPQVGGTPESGAECLNRWDDDGDYAFNDGCPQAGAAAEEAAQCSNDSDDDADAIVHVADPGTDTVIKMPPAPGRFDPSEARPDTNGLFSAGPVYLNVGESGTPGDGTLVRIGLDIGGSGLVTFVLDPPPATAYASWDSYPGGHPVTLDAGELAINQDCPPPGTPTPTPTETPPPTATPTPTPPPSPVPGPANDDFDNAAVIPVLPFVDYLNTRGATTALDDPDCFGRGHTVWYSFTAPENVRIEANTFGSNYDTTLSVYTGSRGALSQIACNDDTDSLQSFVTFDAVAGKTYFLMILPYGGGPGGDLTFRVDVAPPPLEVDASIDPVGAVAAKTGVVTIGGLVTCSKAAFVDLTGELEQRAGRLIVRGYFSTSVLCAGEVPWSATVVGNNGLFKAGASDVSVSAFAFADDEFAFAEASAAVQLKGSRPPKLCPRGGNDGFEAGVVDTDVIPCWTVVDQAASSTGWCNQAGTLPPQGACAGSLTTVAAPPEGAQAVMTNQAGPGSHMLYRCGVLRSGPISFGLYVNNEAGTFSSPSSLDYSDFPNQQFRADLVTAAGVAADPFTTSPADVLLNIYQTLPGDAPVSGYTTVTADASAYMGQPVCLRLAAVENVWFFHAGVDDVSIDLRSRG
jgi:hypothetical protein